MKAFVLAVALLALAGPVLAKPSPPAPASREQVRQMVVQEALRDGRVPPSLALAVAQVESDFVADALSPAGARGVMQIMPATGRGVFGVAPDELWEPRLNIQLGIDFLGQLIERYDGRWDLALSHYNGGSRVGHGASARVIPATRAYVDKVLTAERRYARDSAVRQLVGSVAGANAALRTRASRQAELAGVEGATPDRTERRHRFLQIADQALDTARLRHLRRGERLGSEALLDRIAARKARFRALLSGG
jgi:hypothetical protein